MSWLLTKVVRVRRKAMMSRCVFHKKPESDWNVFIGSLVCMWDVISRCFRFVV